MAGLGSERGIRNVSSTAPLKRRIRGGGGRIDKGSVGVGESRGGDNDRGRAVEGLGSWTQSKLGTRTISSVSNVRASRTCRTDVCYMSPRD